MGSTDPGGGRAAVPVENTVRALRHLAPDALLREARSPELRELARVLRAASPASLARSHSRLVGRVVLAHELRALDRAMTGLFGVECPESARLVRAARFSGTRRAGRRAGPLLDRLRAEAGLRAAASGWAEVTGRRLLAGELRGVAAVPSGEDGLLAAELAVAAVLPRPDFGDCGPGGGAVPSGEAVSSSSAGPSSDAGPGGSAAASGGAAPSGQAGPGGEAGPGGSAAASGGAAPSGQAGLGGEAGPGGSAAASGGAASSGQAGLGGEAGPGGSAAASGGAASSGQAGPGSEAGPGGSAAPGGKAGPSEPAPGTSAFLDVRSLHVGDTGFRVDVEAGTPVELVHDGGALTLRALWWNGLGRVTDDLGHEYLILAKDPAGTGTVRHWCHPRPAPGARVLRLESAGYRGERLRLDPASPGTFADVLVKLELTVRLGA
ncbi:hypothetical protein ACIA5G_21660 [Amycolatopsis sp. NPDC051758]|uniref:hypothetical protein n=1 Tax=Amycolatopsis sp. NPDC051758 TaxID=3363935 RepID=UPI003791781C